MLDFFPGEIRHDLTGTQLRRQDPAPPALIDLLVPSHEPGQCIDLEGRQLRQLETIDQLPDAAGGVGREAPPFGKPDGEVRAGEILNYTLVIDNLGPSNAHAVDVWDLLQSNGIELIGGGN